MKKANGFLWLVLLGALPLFFISHMACTIKGTPASLTLGPTSTPTFTCPAVTLTSGSAVFYSDGTISNTSVGTTSPTGASVSTYPFSGSGGASQPSPTLNNASTSEPLDSHTQTYQVAFDWTSASGGYTGMSLAPTAPATVDLSSFTTCTFFAVASQAASVGFNAAVPGPSGADNATVNENLTTCWQPVTIHIAQGSRSDSNSGAITGCIAYFICSLSGTGPGPGITNFDVYFDQVQFQ